MIKKILITTALLFTFLTPSFASAAIDNTSKLPEFNPFCWHRSDCYKVRQQFLSGSPSEKELEQGFITDALDAVCKGGTGDDQWGRCLPAGQTKTEISFGGQDKFSNIGEFIVLMYKYLLTIASIVAVVVVIISGAQWITSGGNSEAIGSAKKRIAGAFIGLFIAYMSYFVLNTINPALVNLRLPQVWLIKPVELMPEFCRDIENADTQKFMIKTASVNTAEEGLAQGKVFDRTKPEDFSCGARFFVEGGGSSITCKGQSCAAQSESEGEQLACYNETTNRENYLCGHGRVFGDVTNSAAIKNCGVLTRAFSILPGAGKVISPWACPPHIYVELAVVCNNESPLGRLEGNFGYFKHYDVDHYWVESKWSNVRDNMMPRCDEYGGVKGFVLEFEMVTDKSIERNQRHYVGKNGVWLGGAAKSSYEVKDSAARVVYPNLYKIKQQHLLLEDDLRKGVRVDVDAANIPDTIENDEVSWNNRTYWEEQYK